jgi:outer membrane protein OmpA-like peptidoglycan-associated protein
MTTNILDMLTGSFGKDLAGQASKFLGESDGSTMGAVSALLPALLGSLGNKAATPAGAADLLGLVNGANVDTRMLGNLGGLFSGGERTNALVSSGSALAASLLGGGDKVNALASALSAKSGIKASSALSLLAMVVPLVLAFFKRYVADNRLDAGGLAGLLGGQRSFLERAGLDAGILKALGFGSLGSMLAGLGAGASDMARQAAGAAASAAHGATDAARHAAGAAAGAAAATAGAAKSGFAKWWPWILGLIVLWLVWSMFRGPEKPAAPAPGAAPKAAAPAAPAAPAAVTGGLPAKIYFDTGSAGLSGDGNSAIARAAIEIKAGNAKAEITGYTDKAGDAAANEALAKSRAKAVSDALMAAGVPDASIVMKPPMFVTGSGSDAEARRVEITKGM